MPQFQASEAAIAALIALMLAASPAKPAEHKMHNIADKNHWYDSDCCDERDCAPAPDGTVKRTAKGYVVDGNLILFSDKRVRVSQDDRYHTCRVDTEVYETGRVRHGSYVRCLYVPLPLY